jgi:hypothetical protein
MSFLRNLFGNSDADMQTPDHQVPSAPMKPPKKALHHIRANLEQRFVSAYDCMSYLWQINEETAEAMAKRLPRAAIIKAFWPPCADRDMIAEQQFIGVGFSNLHLLYDESIGQLTPQEVLAQVDDFVTQLEYKNVNPDNDTPMMLVTDARRTASQKRYERDVRERTLNRHQYYILKRTRDKAFRSRKALRKAAATALPAVVPDQICGQCSKPTSSHHFWCPDGPNYSTGSV